jgi:hypothetical protein
MFAVWSARGLDPSELVQMSQVSTVKTVPAPAGRYQEMCPSEAKPRDPQAQPRESSSRLPLGVCDEGQSLSHARERLKDPEEPLERLFSRMQPLTNHLGPIVYQLPRVGSWTVAGWSTSCRHCRRVSAMFWSFEIRAGMPMTCWHCWIDTAWRCASTTCAGRRLADSAWDRLHM